MPPLSDKELEERLSAVGNSLRQPPSSSDELLPLLDQIEQLLSKVEQSPSQSMQNSLSPLLDSVVAEYLLKHVDIDVKVGVAACISEITRITAPDTLYDDEKMKEVFHLIVSSFEHLSDNSSRSYDKRVSILETVAKVRSCVIMLDLDCDPMIIDMFNHFLNSIRDFHGEAIFLSMETIITLLLEESEDISPDLLIPILATLKNDNKEALPSAKKLAEKVIQNCSVKLKPYLIQALNVLNASPDDYSEVVASMCDAENINDDKKEANDSTVEATSQEKDSVVESSQKLVETNGVSMKVNLETMTNENDSVNTGSNQQFGDLGEQNPETPEAKADRVVKKKGRKSNSKNPSIQPSEIRDDEKKPEQESSIQEISSKDDSACEAIPVEASKSLDDVKVAETQDSQSKELENEITDVASPTESAKVSEETQSNKSVRAKRRKLGREKASDGTDVLEEKKPLSSKTKSGRVNNKNKPLVEDVSTKNGDVNTSDLEIRSMELTEKVVNDCIKTEEESLPKEGNDCLKTEEESLPKEGNRTKRSRKSLRKDMVNSTRSPVKLAKEAVVESPAIKEKIKQSLSPEKASATTDYNESLVDSKIRVWWPKDKMFYDGVVTSFDSTKKKHKVLYSDGDHEMLNLKKERWEFAEDDSASDGGQTIENSNGAASSDMKRKTKGSGYSESSSKRSKVEDSPKSESKLSSKSKSIVSKSGGKSGGKTETDEKADGKSKGNSKSVVKSAEDDTSKRRGKASGKSVDDGAKTPSNSKQDHQQIIKSKGRTTSSSKSSGANETGIAKSTSVKAKGTDQTKEKVPKTPETDKGKSPNPAEAQENATKSRKKRRK